MISASSQDGRPLKPGSQHQCRLSTAVGDPRPYGPRFWYAYAGNTLLMIGVALLFRYADFVAFLGGSEWHLGWIIGVGMIGSLASRILLGPWIDRYGPRVVWLGSLGLFVISCFGHLLVAGCNTPLVYLLRMGYCSALAGIFAATMTFISGLAPTIRMAEMIGMLGTSGFIGMIVGTQFGDLLFAGPEVTAQQVHQLFLAAGSLGIGAMIFIAVATAGQRRPELQGHPPLLWLVRRHFPGWILLVAIAMGIGISLPGTFLRPYAAELGIQRIGLFFGVYGPAAIITRLITRRWPERFGLTPMVLAGLAVLVTSLLLLLLVRREWMFIIPGISYGIAHAWFFPAVVATGAQFFPREHRGLGTTLMLAAFDTGVLVGSPLVGSLIHLARWLHWPSYPTMLLCVSALLGGIGMIYAFSCFSARTRTAGRCASEDAQAARNGETIEGQGSIGDRETVEARNGR